jgi:hypothetical protein
MMYKEMRCHGSGGQSPTSKGGDPCSTPGRSMWNFLMDQVAFRHVSATNSGLVCQYPSSNAPHSSVTRITNDRSRWTVKGRHAVSDVGIIGQNIASMWFFVYGNNRCCQLHITYINTLCRQNEEMLNVKLMVHRVTTGIWRVNIQYT